VYLPSFDNQTSIPSGELQKGDYWYAVIQVLDLGGVVWSNNVTSQNITVINKAPEVTSIVFMEELDYLLENENITLILTISDPDVNDTDASLIEWMVDGILRSQYTNQRTISSSDTNPGENWTVVITPSDGVDNGFISSRSIIIESIPYIQNLTAIVEQDTDGHFTFGVQVLDALHDISSVEYQILLNGTVLDFEDIVNSPNATDYWLLEYFLSNSDYYNTEALIVVNALSTRDIQSTRTFNFTIVDRVAPRISTESGLGVWFVKDNDNPTSLTFYADIEEYGSGVANVTLYYYYNRDEAGEGTSILQEFTEVLMILESSSAGIFKFSLTVPYPQDDFDYEILYWVSTQDLEGNSDPVAFDIRDFPDRIGNEQIIRPTGGIPEWVLLVAGAAIFLIFIGSVVYVRFIRKPELIGLDKELVLKKLDKISEAAILESLKEHSLGIVVSYFAQQQGPIPIIAIPEVLKDNFDKLIEISDRSFNICGFSSNFENEIYSSFYFELTELLTLRSMSFGYALNRPESRGGQDNITLNILLYQDSYSILNHFQDEIIARVHLIHKMMDKRPVDQDKVHKGIFNLRRFISCLILAYQNIYGMEPPVMEMPEILGFEINDDK